MNKNLLPLTGILAAMAIPISHWFIWSYAPVETTMGLVQKIFYLHLPLAWWAMISFFVVFCAGIAFLVKRNLFWDHVAAAAAEVGVLFSGLMLATGMLWAKPAWNVWWTWDPRLTTSLIMWFVYTAYLIVRASGLPRDRRATICAVLGIVAFLDVPLVFYSARLWRSIHPAVLASKGGGLEPEMKTTMFIGMAAWTFLWLGLTTLRARQLSLSARLDAMAANQHIGEEQ